MPLRPSRRAPAFPERASVHPASVIQATFLSRAPDRAELTILAFYPPVHAGLHSGRSLSSAQLSFRLAGAGLWPERLTGSNPAVLSQRKGST